MNRFLLQAHDCMLMIIDIQERLFNAMEEGFRPGLVRNARILLEASRVLDIPVLVTEQNPRVLGETIAELLGAGTRPWPLREDHVQLLAGRRNPEEHRGSGQADRHHRGNRGSCLRVPDRPRPAHGRVPGCGGFRRRVLAPGVRPARCAARDRPGRGPGLLHGDDRFHAPGKSRYHAIQEARTIFQVNGPGTGKHFASLHIRALKPRFLCDKGSPKHTSRHFWQDTRCPLKARMGPVGRRKNQEDDKWQ